MKAVLQYFQRGCHRIFTIKKMFNFNIKCKAYVITITVYLVTRYTIHMYIFGEFSCLPFFASLQRCVAACGTILQLEYDLVVTSIQNFPLLYVILFAGVYHTYRT